VTTRNNRRLQGWQIGTRTYKVHLDGYNQLPYLTGQEEHSARKGFIYFDDDGHLVAIRAGDWKFSFCEQRTPGGLNVGMIRLPVSATPKIYNLRMDPYERADITSNTYNDWMLSKGFLALV
jgi:arylsulfatase